MIPEDRKKIDYLGEYDKYAVPHEFTAPLYVPERDNAIACASGKILGTYSFVNESVFLAHAKRRAEFAVLLANGEIILRSGQVYKRAGEQDQEGRIVVTYVPADHIVEPNAMPGLPETQEKPGILAKAKAAFRPRGRPRK